VSALSDQVIPENETFNATEYLHSLCEHNKISIAFSAEVRFMSGWKSLVGRLVEAIKNYPIQIREISDYHALLDVKFDVLGKCREVYVWRAIHEAREESKYVCAECGKDKIYSFAKKNVVGMFCKDCEKNAGKIGKTGTWIDRY